MAGHQSGELPDASSEYRWIGSGEVEASKGGSRVFDGFSYRLLTFHEDGQASWDSVAFPGLEDDRIQGPEGRLRYFTRGLQVIRPRKRSSLPACITQRDRRIEQFDRLESVSIRPHLGGGPGST